MLNQFILGSFLFQYLQGENLKKYSKYEDRLKRIREMFGEQLKECNWSGKGGKKKLESDPLITFIKGKLKYRYLISYIPI